LVPAPAAWYVSFQDQITDLRKIFLQLQQAQLSVSKLLMGWLIDWGAEKMACLVVLVWLS
jgi:hypothetical protein